MPFTCETTWTHPWQEWLDAGSKEHYTNPILYNHEYKRRRTDINYYRMHARTEGPQRILDIGCGTGRLLLPFVHDGHQVTGMDRSRAMLGDCQKRLRRLSPRKRAATQLIQADMRQWPLLSTERFSLIVCAFHTFMHLYTRVEIEAFLAQVRAHLAPRGRFIFDVLHPDLEWLQRTPLRKWSRTSFVEPQTQRPYWYSTNHTYDPITQIAHIFIYYEPKPLPFAQAVENKTVLPPVVRLTHRQFFPAELEALLYYNGFSIQRRDGDFTGSAFCSTSEEQILHASLR